MFNKQLYNHISPPFKEFKLLKLHDIIYLQTDLFIHGALYTFSVDCGFHHNTYTILTRRANDLTLPLCRTSHAQQSVIFRGAKLCNRLSLHIKSTVPRNGFKQQMEQKLSQNF